MQATKFFSCTKYFLLFRKNIFYAAIINQSKDLVFKHLMHYSLKLKPIKRVSNKDIVRSYKGVT